MNRPPLLLDLRPGELRPMDQRESEWFVKISMNLGADRELIGPDHPILSDPNPTGQAMRGAFVLRLSSAGIRTSLAVYAVVASWSTSPGDMVLFAHACLELARKRRVKVVTLDMFASLDAFGGGVPAAAAMRRIWDEQKYFDGAQDNWLDLEKAWTLDEVPA